MPPNMENRPWRATCPFARRCAPKEGVEPPAAETARAEAGTSAAAEPAGQKLPAGQDSQADAPSDSWNSPAKHLSHWAALPVENVPAVHAAGSMLPVEHANPAGQSVHSSGDDAPGVAR